MEPDEIEALVRQGKRHTPPGGGPQDSSRRVRLPPGDELAIVARRLTEDSLTAVCVGQILVGDTICCVAIMEVYFVEA
jgi:hypothetical protein